MILILILILNMNIQTTTLREAKCLYLFTDRWQVETKIEADNLRFSPTTLCYHIGFEREESTRQLVTNFYGRGKEMEIGLQKHRVLSNLHEEMEICQKIYGFTFSSPSPLVD